VTITVTPVNDPPVANPDAYDAPEGDTLSVPAPGVLANDVDVDGDTLTAVLVSGPSFATAFTLGADGSFDYTPTGSAGDTDSFTYNACDPALLCSTATVTITVVPSAANIAPFANDDFAEVQRNSGTADAANTFSVTANDVDPDGTIDVATVNITTGGTTQRGGTVVNNGDGTVTYTPKRGFRGTDTFQYEVNDDAGATSNVATVRINVVR
jgi:hypothetical protein